jgi:hypothetical protein
LDLETPNTANEYSWASDIPKSVSPPTNYTDREVHKTTDVEMEKDLIASPPDNTTNGRDQFLLDSTEGLDLSLSARASGVMNNSLSRPLAELEVTASYPPLLHGQDRPPTTPTLDLETPNTANEYSWASDIPKSVSQPTNYTDIEERAKAPTQC